MSKKPKEKHLYYLNELKDYKVAGGYPDIRGWEVRDSDKRVVGKVDNLLVNRNIDRVVYLDIDVDQTIIDARHDPFGTPADPEIKEFVNEEGENHLIIPIGLVDLDEDEKYVFTNRITHKTFAETKRIEKGAHLNRDYEEAVLSSYTRKTEPLDESHQKRRKEEDYADNSVANRWDDDHIVEDENYDRELSKRNQTGDEAFYDREEFDGANFRKRD
ncbi:photosystem reaction center subunit H [Salegentibacter sp.]|uniref:photosystem reaction center subunit H n=1 Tax=Salegentibacter sp. TaxID=1903072 RepID=UPI003564FB92